MTGYPSVSKPGVSYDSFKKQEGMDRMTILEAMDARHSVRAYRNEPIEKEKRQQLDRFAEDCNRESGLHIFLCYDDIIVIVKIYIFF